MNPSNSNGDVELRQEQCGEHAYWWDGEYEGDCELPKGHLEPFHYDGTSYFDDDNNRRDHEQENLVKLIQIERTQAAALPTNNQLVKLISSPKGQEVITKYRAAYSLTASAKHTLEPLNDVIYRIMRDLLEIAPSNPEQPKEDSHE